MFDGEVVVVAEHQRYSYRAYPTAAQTLMLAKTFGCARVVFNDFRRPLRDAYETRGFVPDLDEVKSLVTALAKHTPERHWLSEVSAVALQESARDAQAGYRAFFGSVARTRRGPRVNPPRFKQKSGRQVATSVDGPKPLRIRTWTCRCGATLDRDYNAAVNVMLAAGLAERLNAMEGCQTGACARGPRRSGNPPSRFSTIGVGTFARFTSKGAVNSTRGTATSPGRASAGTSRGPRRPRRSCTPDGWPRRRTVAGPPVRRPAG
ncbi:helix-turn-helix domain-containing protein [Rhodococcus hoagii]|nr:helix-turn-helix domain-containing protein [Prescottella equi]